jgi:hypothetical protein
VRLWDLLPSEDLEANTGYQLLTRAAREQQPARGEFQSSMFGVWVSMSVFPHPEGLSVHVRDISVRKRAEQERELLARELSHRIKNTLAVVQALAMQTDGRIGSVEAFREAFVGRLQAMARSHSLLLDAHWRSADLKSLVEQTVAAYQVDHPEVVRAGADSPRDRGARAVQPRNPAPRARPGPGGAPIRSACSGRRWMRRSFMSGGGNGGPPTAAGRRVAVVAAS